MRKIIKKSFPLGMILLAIGLMTLVPLGGKNNTPESRISLAKPGFSENGGRNISLKVEESYGKLPLHFIRNEGQVDQRAGFYAKARNYTLWFTGNGLVFDKVIAKGKRAKGSDSSELKKYFKPEKCRRDVSRLEFVGANKKILISGSKEQEHRVSYFMGNDRSKWKTGIRTFAEVQYGGVYNNIDLKVYGVESRIEYDWEVLAGGRPSDIRFRYKGVKKIEITKDGDLLVKTSFGELTHRKPVAYQEINGKRVDVVASFKRIGRNMYGFEVGAYDVTRKLTIDPLIYSTYLGGGESDGGSSIAIDGSGNAYVTGCTISSDFPTTAGAYDTSFNGGNYDIFITKLNASGTALVYSTYLGGGDIDRGSSIAVDSSGNAYVTGYTYSSDFPATAGAYDTSYNGGYYYDIFITKLNASGTALVYSTYLGGGDSDYGRSIAVDSSGNAYVTGNTESTDFPTTAGAYDTSYNGGNYDIFITKLNASGTALVYSTYLGGGGEDWGMSIALDSSGNTYVTGNTESTDFPTTAGTYDTSFNGGVYYGDVFITKLNASGTALVYSTYLGGGGDDFGQSIAVDSSGNAYVTGSTYSSDFPATAGAYDTSYNGGNYDIFITKLNASGTALVYSTYLGGGSYDYGKSIAVDSSGNAYVTGFTCSSDFPTTAGAYDTSFNGGFFPSDAFITKLNASGTALVYSTYLGSGGSESGRIAIDGSGNAYVAGNTDSSDFPTTAGAYDTSFNGGMLNDFRGDAFITKFSFGQKTDFLGTWDGQGVYYRNSETAAFVKLATPATLIAAGDLDGDVIDDLIGIWPGQGGVWVKYSATSTWALLSSTARHIAAGDMNGDGQPELLGTWDGQGVYWRNNTTGAWTQLATPATLITSGDLDGDGTDDLIGIWPSQGGVWVKYSQSGTWAKLSTTAVDISAGDMNGDGRDDLVATWDGQGVYYRNSIGGAWVKMATPATQVTAGDLDGDGTDDVIGIWPSQAGVWVKYSYNGAWALLSSTAVDIAAGRMRPAGSSSLQEPGSIVAGSIGDWGPDAGADALDLSANAPGGMNFACPDGENLEPRESGDSLRVPGPGERGFRCMEKKNLVPGSLIARDRDREPKREER